MHAECTSRGTNAIAATLTAPERDDVRIVLRQSAGGQPVRSSGGAPPQGTTLAKLLHIQVTQENQAVPMSLNYDKAIWSGLSWAVGEVKGRDLKRGLPVTIRCLSQEKQPVQLTAELYAVEYR